MALINQPGMFQGTPSLNPLPYVNIAMQARARKAAREEAIDKYYRTLPDTINDKGVRDNEVPIINDIKNKIFDFGLKNKEALKNPKLDNGASQLALDKLMREAQGIVRMSQDEAKRDLEVGKLLFSKDKEYILNSDEFIADKELHDLPVNHPNFKSLDITKYSANKPFDQDKFVKLLKGQFQYETKEVRTPDPTNPLYDNVEKVPILQEKTKENIYAFAADKLHNDFTFKRKIEKDLAGTGQLPKLQKISKEVFGKDIESDEDLAAAYTVSQLYSPPTKVESKVNTGAVMDKRADMANKEWDRRNKLTYAQSLAKIRLNNENRKAGLPTEETGYLSDEVADEVGENQTVTLGGKQREVRVIYTDKVDPKRLAIINAKGQVKPIPIKVVDAKGNPTGELKFGYYQDRTTGDWEGLDSKGNTRVISRERVKDDYIKEAAPTKFKNQTGTKASENTKGQKTTDKPKKDPLGLGF